MKTYEEKYLADKGAHDATDRYRTLLEVNNAIITSLTQEGLLRAICESLQHVIRFDGAGISLYEPELDGLRFFAMEGFFKANNFMEGLVLDRKDSSSGQAFDLQRPVFRRDLEAEQRYSSERRLLAEGIRSICVAPLIVNGKSIGTLNLASLSVNEYSHTDADFLQEVANQVALAVANMQSYEKIKTISAREAAMAKRHRTLLEINNAIITTRNREELLGAISNALQRIVPYDQFGISLYDPETGGLRYFAIEGLYESDHFIVGRLLRLDDSISGLAFTQKQPVLRRDLEAERQYGPEHAAYAEGIRSLCSVPLIAQGQSIGAMGAASRTRNQYDKEIIEFLQEVATQVSLALANVKAYEEITALSAREAATAERRRALLEINNTIIANLDQQGLFHSVCEALRRIIKCDKAGLALYDPSVDDLRVLAMDGSYSTGNIELGQLMDRQGIFTGQEWNFREVILRVDLEIERRYSFEHILYAEGLRSHITLPLIVKGASIGVLGIGSLRPNEYTDADLQLMREVANQVALAIANLQAYEEIQALSEREAAMAERRRALLALNNAIITNLTEESFFHSVCAAMKLALTFDQAGITLYEPEHDALRVFALEGEMRDQVIVGHLLPLKDPRSGRFIDLTATRLISDLETEHEHIIDQQLYAAGMRSYCCVPVFLQGQVCGTIGVGSHTRNQYTQADLELMQEVASQISLAFANMRSYEAIRLLSEREKATAERRQSLLEINNAIITKRAQDELLQAVAKGICRLYPGDQFSFSLYVPDLDAFQMLGFAGEVISPRFTPGLILPRAAALEGRLFDLDHPLLLCDLEAEQQTPFEQELFVGGIRSFCAALFGSQGKIIGGLGIGSSNLARYTEADAAFLQEVGNQVALAVANLQAYEEIHALSEREAAMAERRRTLLEINNAIVTKLTQQDLCEAVFAALPRVVPFDRVGLSLFDYKQDAYRIIAIGGHRRSENFAVGGVVPRQGNWETDQFTLAQPMLRPDLETVERNLFEQQLYEEGMRSFCAAPLLVKNRVIGALSVTSEARNQYSESDVELLQEVANQVAIAIANMQAYEEIAALKSKLQAENIYLQEEIRQEHNFEEIIGNSPALLETLQKVERVARTNSTALILGETGTGKELIARAIHERSARKGRPLVKVNCGAISAGLVESELFGHVKGAFTGAVDRRTGRFELASGGTLFLDEVGELPLDTQVKLLRVLQEGEFEPVGSSKTVRVDVRVIAATNRDLEEAIREGRFRSDLFYRLNVFPLWMPSLHERRSDIPQLATFFLSRFARQFGKTVTGISQETLDLLMNYSWPGNIRELQNIIERGVVLSETAVLTLNRDLLPATNRREPVAMRQVDAAPASLNVDKEIRPTGHQDSSLSLKEAERQHILSVLDQAGWRIEGAGGAAEVLKLHPNTLRSRMKKLAIRRPTHEN